MMVMRWRNMKEWWRYGEEENDERFCLLARVDQKAYGRFISGRHPPLYRLRLE